MQALNWSFYFEKIRKPRNRPALKSAYRYIKAHTSDLTYGALYAQMGNVHGVAQTTGSVWKSGNCEYRWGAESGEYLYVFFSVDANGNERYKGGSSSLGLGD